MDDTLRASERLGDLARDLDRLLGGIGATSCLMSPAEHGSMARKRTGRRAVCPRFLEREQPGDVRVRQRRQQFGLALEALEPCGVGGERVAWSLARRRA